MIIYVIRIQVTPVGLKAVLKKKVDKSVKKCGIQDSFPDTLKTAVKVSCQQLQSVGLLLRRQQCSGVDGSEEVTTQVHKKFLIAANRFYFGSSKYKGVCFNKKKNKWRARISNNGRREFLGDWDSEVEV